MKESLRLEWVFPDTLSNNPLNWRTHPQSQKEQFRALYNEVGWAGALLYNEQTGHLLDGHLRKGDFEKTNEPVPVLIGSWTLEQERLILARLDPIAAMAETDSETLEQLLASIKTDNKVLLDALSEMADENGVAFGELDDGLEVVEDEAVTTPAEILQKKWQVQLGDVWELGPHRLICGDCTDSNVVELLMNNDRWAVMFTDPPYGIAYDTTKCGRSERDMGVIQNDDLEGNTLKQFFVDFLSAGLAHQLNDASVYACGASKTMHWFVQATEEINLHFSCLIVWVKQHFSLNWDRYHPQHELIFFGGNGSKPTGANSRWFGPNNETTVWSIARDSSRDYLHPTQKPIALPARAIKNSSRPNEIIYEPFSGSGSTLMACQQLNRVFRGVELEPKYVAVALERYSVATDIEPVRKKS